jgi:putative DNA primase/helicase
MAAYDVQERFKQLNFSASTSRKAPLFIYSDAYANSLGIPRANLLNPRWREALKKSLIEKQVKLFVIDNISSLAPGIEENSKFEWDPVNQWLLGLRFAGITSFLLHHVGKEGNQRGTSAREDNLDVSLVLQRPHDYVTEEGARFVVKFKKARVPTRELSLMSDVEFCLSEVEGRLQWTWNEVKRKNQVEILKMLDEGVPQKDIAQALCVTAGFVSQVKSKAIGDGHLSKTGKLTESGFLLVNSGEENEEIY